MNELQRTQRISIAVLVLTVALALGLMIKEKPKFSYAKSATEMLAMLPDIENITPGMAETLKNDLDNYVFIDIRSPYDFEVKHIENAINIPLAFLLDEENVAQLNEFQAANKTVVLYGETEHEAISPWILLYEIGYTNTRILSGGFECFQHNTPNCNLETARHDFAKIATQGGVKEVEVVVEKPQKKEEPKKVIPVQKKVKAEAEGGC